MKVSELIAKLIELKKEHGDIEIATGAEARAAGTVFVEDFPFYGTYIVIE